MKKTLLLIGILCFAFSSKAQITFAHAFGPANSAIEIVNLSISGKKIMVTHPIHVIALDSTHHTYSPDTITFYNLDYSFWKRIICPYIPGYIIINGSAGGMSIAAGYYPSETLFNTDPLLEIALPYISDSDSKILIFNETGARVDSITGLSTYGFQYNGLSSVGRYMIVYAVDTLGVSYQAAVNTPTGTAIYNLPGTLPCNMCSSSLAVAKNDLKSNNIQTQPMPNPSKDQVKITFTLPPGSDQGNLIMYNTSGQKIRSYAVDGRFGFILVDNSTLASGVYYYNIEVNGQVSSTQKMVVVK